jgi:hypothetical protein
VTTPGLPSSSRHVFRARCGDLRNRSGSGRTSRSGMVATLIRVSDYPDFDDDLADESEDEVTAEDENAHTLSIRRATGEEVLTIFSPNEEWSVYLQPGGGITNAFVGSPSDPIVWVNPTERPVERDEDGTYVIRID